VVDERALWDAIRAAPEDGLVRLAYADWLEERDEPVRASILRAWARGATPHAPPGDVTEALGGWLAASAPAWCLLGGGLPGHPFPVPDWLLKENAASWRAMIAFYDDMVDNHGWKQIAPLGRLVREFADTQAAMLFRAGQSLVTFMASAADRHGLRPEEPFVAAEVQGQGKGLSLSYWPGEDGTGPPLRQMPDWTEQCDEAGARPRLARLLARLWTQTREPMRERSGPSRPS
jgi:uncharacterized protein (TIGR02996 family)